MLRISLRQGPHQEAQKSSTTILPRKSFRLTFFPFEETSEYNKKNHVLEAFKELIDHADAKCIIFHYTDYGLIRIEDARKILSSYGTVEKECYFNSKGYSTSSHERKENKHHIIKVCR